MKKVIIIGANGFVGRRILKRLGSSGNFMLTALSFHADIFPESYYRFIKNDMTDKKAISRIFNDIRPDAVINCSALSVPDYCEQHKDEAYRINVEATSSLADLCNEYDARLVHLSTDFVFSGNTDRLHTEDEETSPVNYYGITKLEGERKIISKMSDYAIARIVVVYGNALPGQHGNICQLVKNRLSKGEEINVASDQWRTPTWVEDVAIGAEKLIGHHCSGIYNICGNEYLSIADLAYRVADFFRLDRSLIHPVTTEEMNEKTPRPRFSGLSIAKAREELGYLPHSIEYGLAEMV